MAPAKVSEWSVDQVGDFLQGLQLGGLAPAFKENAVDGKDLLNLTDDDYIRDLKLTNLQVKKVKNALAELGASPAAQPAPSPPGTATGIPADSAPFTPPAFDAKDLSTYKSLTSKITDLESQAVENKAASAWHRMKQLSGQRAAAGREVQAAVAAKEEAEKKLEKLDHWYPGKLIIGEAKRQAKHDTRQQEYEETCKRLGQAQGKTAELDTQVKNATKEAEALQEQVEELKRARGQLAELQQRIFVAPEWAGHPMLSALGRDAADMERRAAEAGGHAGTYQRAGQLLRSADQKIGEGVGALRRTRFMGMMEMGMDIGSPFRRPGGSLFMDMGEMMMVQRANDLVKSAAQDVEMARQVLPSLPFTKEGALQAAQMGVFASMLLPGIGGNMMEQMMLQKSMNSVREMEQQVQECAQWVQRNLDAFSLDVNRMRATAAEKRAQAVALQRSMLDAAVA